MNNLKEKINSDFKEAFKAKEPVKISVLKMVRAAIGNAEIEKRAKLAKEGEADAVKLDAECQLNDEEILQIISREVKKRKDAVELYKQGGREELAAGEKSEIDILAVYLPAQMSEDEIKGLVKKSIADSGAKSAEDFGRVMKAVSVQTKGRADGGLVSKIVKELLG